MGTFEPEWEQMAKRAVTELRSVYLIHSEDEYLLESALARLRASFSEALADDASDAISTTTFGPGDAGATEIVFACNTLSFLEARRLVVVRGAELMDDDEQQVLADYMSDPNPATVAVFVMLKPGKKKPLLFHAAEKLGLVNEYPVPKKSDYPEQVIRMFADLGKRAGRDAARTLVDAVGYDLRGLDTEVHKIATYLGAIEHVTEADVREVVETVADISVFELVDHLSERRAADALRALQRLVSQSEDPNAILGGILWRLRQLVAVRAGIDRGDNPDAAASAAGMAPWQYKRLLGPARRYSAAELDRAMVGAAELDAVLKRTSGNASLRALELWMIEMCGTSR